MNVIGTTPWHPSSAEARRGEEKCAQYGIPFVKRTGTMETILTASGMEGCLVWEKEGPAFCTTAGTYRFHVGTAKLRILELNRGNGDRLCDFLSFGENVSFLDCTFGHGGDAMVVSYFLGNRGHVVALEKSIPLYIVGKEGIDSFRSGHVSMDRAMRRIALQHSDFFTFLKEAEDESFDVVYFDTMFRYPVKREINKTKAFREAACYDSLDESILKQALRVSKKAVIVKERPFSSIFEISLFEEIQRRNGQSTAYGVIRK